MEIKGRGIDGFLATPPAALRVAVFYGPDSGLVRERASLLARKIVDDLRDPFRVCDLSASDIKADPARLADEAAAISMMGGRRVVRVRDADHATAKVMEAFLEDMPGDALIVVEAGDIGKGALTRAFEGAGQTTALIACYPDEGDDLRTVIVSTLKARGLSIASDALADLMARLGDDRRMTRMELEKLALYVGPDDARAGQVTRDHVDAVLGVEAEADINEITDACAGGDVAMLDSAFARALAGGETSAGILRMVLMHMQRVHLGASLIAEGLDSDKAVDKSFPRLIWKRKAAIQRQLAAWTPVMAMEAIRQLADAEMLTRRTEIPADAVTGRALLMVAAAARRQSRRRA
jgi:DNA polymerase-3 subunit delta